MRVSVENRIIGGVTVSGVGWAIAIRKEGIVQDAFLFELDINTFRQEVEFAVDSFCQWIREILCVAVNECFDECGFLDFSIRFVLFWVV